jgi:hypothetical protein
MALGRDGTVDGRTNFAILLLQLRKNLANLKMIAMNFSPKENIYQTFVNN